MKIRELIGDWLMNTDIVTEALNRSKASERISGFTTPIVNHIIKVLKWKDPLNYRKHLGDIDDWIHELADVSISGGKRPTSNDYNEWIIGHTNINIERWMRKLNRDYKSLPVMRSDAEVDAELTRIMTQLVDSIISQTFNSIEQFVPNDYDLPVNDWDDKYE
jgi:hypothetical protein